LAIAGSLDSSPKAIINYLKKKKKKKKKYKKYRRRPIFPPQKKNMRPLMFPLKSNKAKETAATGFRW
jgi:hypothetical protein